MLTSELSSIVLGIPNDAYTTLSPNLIGCSALSQEYCKLIGSYWKNNEKATLNINMPYYTAWLLGATKVWAHESLFFFFCDWQIPITLHKTVELDKFGSPVLDTSGRQVMKCGFRIGGGIDQDPSRSPQGYPDKVRQGC